MPFLITLVILALLIVLLLFLPVGATLIVKNSDIWLRLRVGAFSFRIYPSKQSPFSYRRLAKQLRGQKLAGETPEQKKVRKKNEEKGLKKTVRELTKTHSFPSFLRSLRKTITHAANKYMRHLHIKLHRLILTVGGDTPDKTGITYGVVAQSLTWILEFLDHTVSLSRDSREQVKLQADFAYGQWQMDMQITFKIRIVHLLSAAISSFRILQSSNVSEKSTLSATPLQNKESSVK